MALVEVSGRVLCVSIWGQLVHYSGGGRILCAPPALWGSAFLPTLTFTLIADCSFLSIGLVRQISVPKQTRRKLQWRKSLLTCCYLNSTWGQENRVLSDSYRVIVPFNESYRKIGGLWLSLLCTHDQNSLSELQESWSRPVGFKYYKWSLRFNHCPHSSRMFSSFLIEEIKWIADSLLRSRGTSSLVP